MSILTTKRLVLRQYETSDRDDYIALVTEPDVMRYIDGGVVTRETAEIWWHRLINKQYPSGVRWCARTQDSGEFAGHAMINYTRPENACELGYILPKSKWGMGYATEIAESVAGYSQAEMNLSEIYATVNENHEASVNVLEKIGMRFHGYDFDDDGRFLVYVLEHRQN